MRPVHVQYILVELTYIHILVELHVKLPCDQLPNIQFSTNDFALALWVISKARGSTKKLPEELWIHMVFL